LIKDGGRLGSRIAKTILGDYVLNNDEIILGLPLFQITGIQRNGGEVRIAARYAGPKSCPHCHSGRQRSKGWYCRQVRHENFGLRHSRIQLRARKWQCLDCGRQFRQRLPGILPGQHASEAFREAVFEQHLDGVNRSRLGRREGIGAATVERYFRHGLARRFSERHSLQCPSILGIDEHFFTRKKGFATTLCDLKNHSVYDVVLGRSDASLETCFQHLENKHKVRVVCMDLSSTYRAIVKKHFPQARIVADRFHVIRLINQHFLACWRELDPTASKNRGLMSLMRRHRHNLKPEQRPKLQTYLDAFPAMNVIYRFKQRLCYLLLKKHRTRQQCIPLVARLLAAVDQLRNATLPQLVTLGDTLHTWKEEIATMWRFTRNNGITEGFHNKMETISRQAYGFRNFENYRLRVKVLCG
jgi:transposase